MPQTHSQEQAAPSQETIDHLLMLPAPLKELSKHRLLAGGDPVL
jgi:hypothetical protein